MRSGKKIRQIYIANNALLFERISNVELKQLEYQKKTDEKLEQIFEYISDHEESNQKIFFDGQIYDAFSLLIGLIQKAEMEIVLVDGYVDVGTLNIFSIACLISILLALESTLKTYFPFCAITPLFSVITGALMISKYLVSII